MAGFEGFQSLDMLVVDLTTAGAGATRIVADVLAKSAHDIEATAKQLVPIDTGATKNSIGVDLPVGKDLVAEIGPTTEYAPHLEYGTSRMGPRAFMGPALDIHGPRFVAAVTQAAEGLL